MNKKAKKLRLSRETLRGLDKDTLRQAAGGDTTVSGLWSDCFTCSCVGTICDTCFTRLQACTEACG